MPRKYKKIERSIEKPKDEVTIKLSKLKKLEHFRDSSIGLWCTDKPEILESIPEEIKKRYFFKLKD